MSDELPTKSDTPPDHRVIALKLDPDTLPEWWDRIVAMAPAWVRRMSVVEDPKGWLVKVELHEAKVDGFYEALSQEWAAYQAQVSGQPTEGDG